MKLAIAYQDGQVADASGCTEYLIITARGGEPSGKELMAAPGAGSTAMLTFLGMVQADVFICGALGVAMRNALEMLGIVPVSYTHLVTSETAEKPSHTQTAACQPNRSATFPMP